ncbi:hypothetical protein LXL04_019747 [Taraxacum kok-saghyz]
MCVWLVFLMEFTYAAALRSSTLPLFAPTLQRSCLHRSSAPASIDRSCLHRSIQPPSLDPASIDDALPLAHLTDPILREVLILRCSKPVFDSDRHVVLPPEVAKLLPKNRLLAETEWRAIGVQQSRGWVHYAIHRPEPHIMLFRRPLNSPGLLFRTQVLAAKRATGFNYSTIQLQQYSITAEFNYIPQHYNQTNGA